MVYLLAGKVLLDGSGHVAFDPACCCGVTGRCSLCKLCLGPHNTCDCGLGDGTYDCGYLCIDGITEAACHSYFCQGYSTAWLEGGVCSDVTPCDLFSGGCAHLYTCVSEPCNCFPGDPSCVALGQCCFEGAEDCGCTDDVRQDSCELDGGTFLQDCGCLLSWPFGCDISFDCNTGACCTGGGACAVTTYSVCVGFGGNYQGGGTTCPNSVCNEC